MPVENTEVSAVFDEIADLLEIKGSNPFRIRAYRRAAQTLRELGINLREYVAEDGDLTDLPGIGRDLAEKIQEILETGRCRSLSKLRREIPGTVTDLLRIPGLGPRRVRVIYNKLGITSLHQLLDACAAGKIRKLPGFGARTEQHIMEAIKIGADSRRRFLLAEAEAAAALLVRYLKKLPCIQDVVVAGSFRRARETVGDLDILVTAGPDCPVMDKFTGYNRVRKVISRGSTRSSIVLSSGIQVDIRVVGRESFGSAFHYFTGSKAHNIALRRLSQDLGLKINEYGVFRDDSKIAGETEESVFRSMGLDFIPPELREDRGEIEAATEGGLPDLVTMDAIRGDLHVHSSYSDGKNSIRELAVAANRRGYEYIAVTDHSQRLRIAGGLDSRKLLRQIREIDRLNQELDGIFILKGLEVDILEDGTLDMPDDVLSRLDLVIGSVHSSFNLSEDKQTERILRALENPHIHILGHPTCRRLRQRPPCSLDMVRIIKAAAEAGRFLELNANPERLDLSDIYCRMARDAGVLISINTDAHSTGGYENMRYGIGQARRGWLESRNVLNTRPLGDLLDLLHA